jgi:hypothetical protein
MTLQSFGSTDVLVSAGSAVVLVVPVSRDLVSAGTSLVEMLAPLPVTAVAWPVSDWPPESSLVAPFDIGVAAPLVPLVVPSSPTLPQPHDTTMNRRAARTMAHRIRIAARREHPPRRVTRPTLCVERSLRTARPPDSTDRQPTCCPVHWVSLQAMAPRSVGMIAGP